MMKIGSDSQRLSEQLAAERSRAQKLQRTVAEMQEHMRHTANQRELLLSQLETERTRAEMAEAEAERLGSEASQWEQVRRE